MEEAILHWKIPLAPLAALRDTTAEVSRKAGSSQDVSAGPSAMGASPLHTLPTLAIMERSEEAACNGTSLARLLVLLRWQAGGKETAGGGGGNLAARKLKNKWLSCQNVCPTQH